MIASKEDSDTESIDSFDNLDRKMDIQSEQQHPLAAATKNFNYSYIDIDRTSLLWEMDGPALYA